MIEITVEKRLTASGATEFLATPSVVALGGRGNALVDSLHLTLPPEWDDKMVTVAFLADGDEREVAALLSSDRILPLLGGMTARGTEGVLTVEAVGEDGYQAYSAPIRYTVYDHPSVGDPSDLPSDRYVALVEETAAAAANAMRAMIDQTYTPDSEDAQSGKAVAEAVALAKAYTDDKVGVAADIAAVDQTYTPTSTNPQSGTAVAEAVDECKGFASNLCTQEMDTAVRMAIRYTDDEMEALRKELLLLAHPVGSFYWSREGTAPSLLFGGTWQQVKDTFLLAAGDLFAAGTTGGEATHALTDTEMPSHTHNFIYQYDNNEGTNTISGIRVDSTKWGNKGLISSPVSYIRAAGGNQPHNNMPPYEAVYCWVRTA